LVYWYGLWELLILRTQSMDWSLIKLTYNGEDKSWKISYKQSMINIYVFNPTLTPFSL
jgi:hypothetical protein